MFNYLKYKLISCWILCVYFFIYCECFCYFIIVVFVDFIVINLVALVTLVTLVNWVNWVNWVNFNLRTYLKSHLNLFNCICFVDSVYEFVVIY